MKVRTLLINGILSLKTNQGDLDDDLLKPLLEDINTPGYISKLHLLYDKASKEISLQKTFLSGCKLIGLLEEDLETWKNLKNKIKN